MSLTSRIQALTAYANEVTGESDTTLADAIATLAQGYGQGGGFDINDLADGTFPVGVITIDTALSLAGHAFAFKSDIMGALLKSPTILDYRCFESCTNLAWVDVSKTLGQTGYNGINTATFIYCSALNTIILRGSGISTLSNANAFLNTPFASGGTGGTLYVPQALISSYQSATNWSTILGYTNNQILPIEGSIYETQYADGTSILQ